jgi:NitT/TauT family transport system permease protein
MADTSVTARDGSEPRTARRLLDDGGEVGSGWRQRLWFPISLVLLVLVWHVGVRVSGVNPVLMPTPLSVAEALWEGLSQTGPASFYPHFWRTLQEVLLGFLGGLVVGLLLGGLVALSPTAQVIIRPYIILVEAVPKIAIAPLMVVWLGFGMESKVALAVLVTFFPIFVNTVSGVRSVPAERLELMSSLKAGKAATIRMVIVPSALPFIFAGLEIAAVYAVIAAIVSEFVNGQMGLGVLILQANFRLDIAQVFAILILLGLMGIGMSKVIELARRRFVFWDA